MEESNTVLVLRYISMFRSHCFLCSCCVIRFPFFRIFIIYEPFRHIFENCFLFLVFFKLQPFGRVLVISFLVLC
jgi:hypothetical protein